MTNRRRSVKPLITAIGLCGVLLVSSAWLFQLETGERESFDWLQRRSHKLLSYMVHPDQPVTFRVFPQDERVELLTNLNISPEAALDIDRNWEYSLQAEILDESGDTLEKRMIWETTRRSRWADDGDGRTRVASFYRNSVLVPCDSRASTVEINNPQARFIRVRLAHPSDGSAAVRCYQHLEYSTDQEIGIKPLSGRLKAKIRRHNIYGLGVTDSELRRFLADVWKQVPAEGRSSQDYFPKEIFLYNYPLPMQGEIPEPAFITLDMYRPVSYTASGPGTLIIRSEDELLCHLKIFTETETQFEDHVKIRSEEEWTYTLDSQKYLVFIEKLPERGMGDVERLTLEMRDLSGHIRDAYQTGSHATRYFRTVPGVEGAPVIVKLHSDQYGRRLPLKIGCRGVIHLDDRISRSEFAVDYLFKNADGQILLTGSYAGSSRVSRLAVIDDPLYRTTVPDFFYLRAPQSADSIEFTSNVPVDLAFYSCLETPDCRMSLHNAFEQSTRESNRRFVHQLPDEKDWYYFRPSNSLELNASGRSHLVRQPEGIIEFEESDAGESSVTAVSLIPDGIEPQYLYEPVEDTARAGTRAYFRLESGQSIRFEIKDHLGYPQNLRCRYYLDTRHRPEIAVKVDHRDHDVVIPIASEGVFVIRDIEPGFHDLKLELTDGQGEFYILVTPEIHIDQTLFASRRVFALEPGAELLLSVEKMSWMRTGVNVMVYTDDLKREEGVEINISADALPLPVPGRSVKSLTIPNRIYRIEGDTQTCSGYLQSGESLPFAGRLFFPLNDDLPPGIFNLKIRSNTSETLYFRFFSLVPGDSDRS